MAKVVLRDGGITREYMILGEVTIGRLPENTIQVADSSVSRKHARLMAEGQDVIIEDLASAGGTQVNGVAVKKQVLRHGDVILIGNAKLSFVGEEPPKSDPLFEKTLIGQDPLFAPTMMAPPPAASPGLPVNPAVSVPPPPPPSYAQPPAPPPPPDSRPVSVSAMPRPQIILPRKSVIQTIKSKRGLQFLTVGILLLAAALLFGPDLFTKKVDQVDWAPIEALAKDGRWPEVETKLKEIEGLSLGVENLGLLQKWKQRTEAEAEGRMIEALIFEKHEFSEAYRRAQTAGNKFAGLGSRFGDLSKIAFTATFAMDAATEVEKAGENPDRAVLVRVVALCKQVAERHADQKAVLQKLAGVERACQTCLDRRSIFEKRLAQYDAAERLWGQVPAVRQREDWAQEIQILQELAALPPTVSGRVIGPVPAEALLKNATSFAAGLADYQKGDFTAAAKTLDAIEAGDFHAAAARSLLEEMRQTGGYNAAVRLYREGKGDEAYKALRDTNTEKARTFRARIEAVLAGYGKLLALRERKALDDLVTTGEAFLATLDAEADSYYFAQTKAAVTTARGQRYEQRLAELEELVQQRKYGEAFVKSTHLLAGMDQAVYPELHGRVTKLREGVLQVVQKDIGQWVKAAEDSWSQYQKSPIVSEERTATQGITDSYRRKAELLRRGFEQIAQVQSVIEVLPAERAKPVMELFEGIRHEIVVQAEKVFNVRTQYSQMGNFKLTKQADEMILMLGNTPGNPYFGMASGKKD